jgi:pimeloyl-ACP methyl ester carboxylesterase
MKINNFFRNFLKYIFKILKILLIFFAVLFVILSILPYLLPVNQQKVSISNLPFKESKIIKIDSANLHYRDFSAKSDSVKGNILFIHGFSGSTFSWRNNMDYFATRGYHVIAVDLPAFGFSEKENNNFDHSAAAHAEKIWKLLGKADLNNEKWTVCGHSMGAGIAWEMAKKNPEKTNQLLMVDGVGNMGPNGRGGFGSGILKTILQYPPLLRWVDVIAGYYFFKQNKFEDLLSSAYSRKADTVDAAGYLRPFLIKNSGSAIIKGFLNNKTQKDNNNKINCPVRLLWGTSDNWVPLSVAEKFICKYPDAGLKTIEKAGHCPMETHSKEFNTYLLGLLEKN